LTVSLFVRYLDIETWGDQEQRPTGGHEEQKFLGQLHTLRWSGRITYPLPGCEIRRISSDRLTDDDINGLASCSKLLEFSTDQADIESPSKLFSFTRLERLHLRHLHTVDASPIAQLTALRELSLPAAKMTSFDFISSPNELRVLDLSQTMITSIEPLAKLTRLETLNVFEDKITDLSPLRNLTMLTELDLSNTKVVDIASLGGLIKLQTLNLAMTDVNDLGPLNAHPALEWEILYGSQLQSVDALLTMPKLKRAHIGGLSLPTKQLDVLKQRLGSKLDD
jgi:Leucine-rich repeat (LRR) protein